MSIVFSEKTRRTRLALRWPFSRQITLSVGTLLLLLAVWWAVAAQQRNWLADTCNLSLYEDKTFPLPDNFFDDYEDRKSVV